MQRPDYSKWPEAYYKVNDQVNKNKELESKTEALSVYPRRSFAKTPVTGSLAAATMNNLTTILKTDQLKQCGLAYINNGIVRTIVDRTVYFINPERTDFVIQPNEELTTGLDDDKVKELEEQIKNDTLTNPETGEPLRILELRQKLTRINKRVRLHSSIDKLLASTLIYGRGMLEIISFGKSEEDAAGQPRALRHLSPLRIQEVKANQTTGEFEGIVYSDDNDSRPRNISRDKLVPAFNDDYNVLDNSNFSGVSAVWPILEAANTIDVILAEDMPEIARQSHSKFGIMYAGTSKKSTIRKLKEELEAGTWLVHNEQQLTADVHDLSLDPMKMMDVITALSKHMCIGMNLPLFMLHEDTANFATANQVMQVYKTGVLNRYRTWLQGILEDYWYDPILADHLGIEVKDVISAPIKIKALFQDINFETRSERIASDKILQDALVFKPSDTARDIEEDKIADRLKFEETELDEAIKTQKLQSIEIADQNAKAFQQNLKNPQKGNTPFGRKPGSGSSNSSQDSSKQQ